MKRVVAQLKGDVEVYFSTGNFDDWCVYVEEPNRRPYAPRDTDYFEVFRRLGVQYGASQVYQDFVEVYNRTTFKTDSSVIDRIRGMALRYHSDEALFALNMSVIYAGMVAEENKERAILRKRIKRLGMHQVMVLGMEPSIAANFSRGKRARAELMPLCEKYGF